METACLRIKFTPLMKNIHMNDSKCCLEIVPEVSSLKNFDKIEWKQDQKFYEYVIPMTYKIILKRRDNQDKDVDDRIENLNPIYHSCVDLLHPSVTSTCLASGDIDRIVSDNFILSKVTTDIEKSNIILAQSNKMSNVKNMKAKITTSIQTVEASDVTAVHCKNNEGFEVTESTKLVEQSHQRAVVKFVDIPTKSLDKIIDNVNQIVEKGTSFPTIPPLCSSDHNLSSEMTNHEERSERSCTGSVRKLSLTPICSINTNDDGLTIPSINNFNSITSPDYQSEKDIVLYGNLPTIEERIFHFLSPSIKIDTIRPKHFAPTKRLTPEERIGDFLKLMQKEILPLKSMLNDIITRYTALNINQNFHDKTVSSKKQQSDVNKIKGQKNFKGPLRQMKSNRVVYSIVFDG